MNSGKKVSETCNEIYTLQKAQTEDVTQGASLQARLQIPWELPLRTTLVLKRTKEKQGTGNLLSFDLVLVSDTGFHG